LGLHFENFELLPRFLGDDGAEDLASCVVDGDVVNERLDEVDAGIKRARTGAGNLADADACRAAGHDRNAQPGEYCQPSGSRRACRRFPANGWGSRQLRRTLRKGCQPAGMFPLAINVIDRAGDRASKSSKPGDQEHVLEEQHGSPPYVTFFSFAFLGGHPVGQTACDDLQGVGAMSGVSAGPYVLGQTRTPLGSRRPSSSEQDLCAMPEAVADAHRSCLLRQAAAWRHADPERDRAYGLPVVFVLISQLLPLWSF